MEPSDVLRFIGRPVADLYGRHVGLVVGYSLKTTGEVESVGLDLGSGSFQEVRSDRLIIYDTTLMVVPAWKAELMWITSETNVLRKRLLALQELGKEADAPTAQFDQLGAQYRARLAKVRESTGSLLEAIKSRLDELVLQDQALSKFMVNVGIQFRSEEISEQTYSAVSDQCGRLRAKNSKEQEELASARAILMQSGGFEIEEEPAKRVQAVAAQPARRRAEDPKDSVQTFVDYELSDWKGARQ